MPASVATEGSAAVKVHAQHAGLADATAHRTYLRQQFDCELLDTHTLCGSYQREKPHSVHGLRRPPLEVRHVLETWLKRQYSQPVCRRHQSELPNTCLRNTTHKCARCCSSMINSIAPQSVEWSTLSPTTTPADAGGEPLIRGTDLNRLPGD